MYRVMPTPRRILVIKLRHIGDVLLTAPVISTLRAGIPQATICAIVRAGTESMLEGHPGLDRVLVLPLRRHGESAWSILSRHVRFLMQLRREKFDLAINMTEGDRGILLARWSGARERWGIVKRGKQRSWRAWLLTHSTTPIGGMKHTVLRNLELIAPLGLPECRDVTLSVDDSDRARVGEILSRSGSVTGDSFVHCHPTSRWMFKRWPESQVAPVIDWLQSRGLRVVLTCAPDTAERAMIDAILASCQSRPIDLGGQLTLKQIAALSSMSRIFIGVDSAPMHMSAAMGTPTLGVFGPSRASRWGPWPNGFSGSETPYPGMSGIRTRIPHVVVQDNRPCVPCGRDGCEGTKRSACLEELAPQIVIAELERMLST